jgi:hypothetical protein
MLNESGYYVCVIDIRETLDGLVERGIISYSDAEVIKLELMIKQKYLEQKNG